jgi:heparan-alpha-glucosaminide N-acetyltransferase
VADPSPKPAAAPPVTQRAAVPSSGGRAAAAPPRILSIDAYRGFVMFLMMAEILHLSRIAAEFPESAFWQQVGFHTSHVEWFGCSLHDLIQPSFSFLVGVALPFSLAARVARGQSSGRMFLHALWRAAVLVALGIFLRSVGHARTNFTFEDTLTQIGLGYPFLFLVGRMPRWTHGVALLVVLAGYWGAFAWFPAAGADFDYAAVGVPPDWPNHLTGLGAHWNKNSNLAWSFDTWFLNLFPRDAPFTHNGGGYATLSFIPTLGTMLLGLIAGGWLKSDMRQWRKLILLFLGGGACLAAGWALHEYGLCPVVKRIWTPSWALYSGGWCLLMLGGFSALLDGGRFTFWAFPFIVIGANSIAIYSLVHLIDRFIIESLKTHLGQDIFGVAGPVWEPLLAGAAALLVFWLLLLWMYRRRIFIRV